jgi:nicotinate-nucleotide pyrophosphorylase (carboxylating)
MHPNPKEARRIIASALAEDIGKGDVTAKLLVPTDATATLFFVNRESVVICGTGIIPMVFAHIDPAIKIKAHAADGDHLAAGTRILSVSGPARTLLTAERTALNLLQRMSAVATLTARYVRAVAGTKAVILDTRKTMPGLRELDKYAVRTGGGRNHRMRLDDGILIKDNHIALAGSVGEALKRAQAGNSKNLPIEIECDTLAQVKEALAAGAKSILLDNMDLPTLRKAVQYVAGRATLEASGNVSLDTVRAIAETGVDFISAGALTHSAPNVDIGLDITMQSPG